MITEAEYWLAFSVFPGIGPMRFGLLRQYFGTAKASWSATVSDLSKTGLGENLIVSFEKFRHEFDINGYKKKLKDLHVTALTLDDPRYPKRLHEISDAPIVLYVLGHPSAKAVGGTEKIDMNRTIAVVGTRKITQYGNEVTKNITSDLSRAGMTIVSGMAYGVDAVAHQAAIDAGGKTIAVLGCGIDVIAPSSNARLYHDIINGHGAIVSEMPLGLRPGKGLFPARNRIISGLSLGVLVTEGADDSGALITARYAAEQGRDVFAVPGPVTSLYSKGPSKLIKNGAKLVESAQDILEELQIDPVTNFMRPHDIGQYKFTSVLTLDEKKIVEYLIDRRLSIDELVRATNLTIQVIAATLTGLEIKGIVKDFGEKEYGLV